MVLALIMILGLIPWSAMPVEAASTLSLAELQAKFPSGKYWNHYVNNKYESYNYLKDQNKDGFADSTSSTACWNHKDSGYDVYEGHYDCNRFGGATQCNGFAYKLAFDAYGTMVSTWGKAYSISSLKPGDVVHYKGAGADPQWGHWVFVTAVSGTSITVGECNWGAQCVIKWGRSFDLSNATSFTIYSAPYALSGGSSSTSNKIDSRYPTPFKAYNLANAKTPAYDVVSGSSVGYIYASDECTIQEVYTNGWCKVLCPWTGYSNGRIVYAQLSTFLNTGYTPSKTTVSSQTTTYTRSNASTSYGYIGAGDTVTKVGSSGSYTQIIYPLSSGGYKCAWAILPTSVSTVSYPVPFKCRTISTDKVVCYNDINYTSSPGKIYPDDDCVITAVYSNGKVQCKVPWSDGTTKTVYVDKSVFINSSSTPITTTAPNYAKTYLRTDMSYNIGWIDAGNEITIVATSGDKTQIIYPADVGKRCAWVYTSNLKRTYTVSYNANGGTGAPSSQTKSHGVPLTLSSTIPTRTGYTFIGWSTSATANTATYAAGGAYTTNSNATLYAVWKIREYNVSYDANGGIGAPPPQTKTHGVSLTLSSVVPTMTGYTFVGWSTAPTDTTAVYRPGGAFTTNASVTLYAVWKQGCPGNHDYCYNVTKAPTTSASGTLTGTCANCSGTTTVTLPKLNTTDYTYKVVTAATCTANGTGRYTWKTTTYGSYYFDVTIAKTGHSYTYKVTKAPTTSATGTLTGTCANCSGTTTVTLPKLNTTDYTYKVVTAATCTANGTGRYTWKTTTYGSYYFDVTIGKTGHTYTYKVTKAPTTSASGTLTGTCSRCSGTTTVTLPKLNTTDYTYKVVTAATCTANGTGRYTWKTTTYGSYYFDVTIAKTGHSYTYKVTKAPTTSVTGTLTGTCANCSGTTTVTLPKLNTTDYTYKVIKEPSYTATGTGRYTWKTTTYGTFYFDVTLDKLTATLTKLEVATKPTKTVYKIGESLDTSGLTLKATYSDGTARTITSGFTTSGFDSSSAGEKTVTVSYGGKSTTFTVTVEEKTEVDLAAPQIVVERVNARAGKTVSVNVRVKNNPGISSAAVKIEYDTGRLKLDSAVFGDAFSSGAFTNYNLPYATLVRSGDVTEDGIFLVLTFTVLDTADVGDAYVTIAFKDGDITNSDEEDVPLAVSGGGVSIVNYIPGDINDDGVVNTKDLTRLLKYLSHEDVSVNTYALDVNGDGAVNTKDLTRLLKYISHEDVKIY